MNDLNNMMCLDVFLIQSSEREQMRLKNKIGPAQVKGHPLQCWDIASMRFRRPKFKVRSP